MASRLQIGVREALLRQHHQEAVVFELHRHQEVSRLMELELEETEIYNKSIEEYRICHLLPLHQDKGELVLYKCHLVFFGKF